MYSTKVMLGVVVALVFLTLTQCTVKKPESPTWTTQFTLPVVNRTYTMPEIIDKLDAEGIEFDADSNIVYTLTRDIDTISLEADELTTSDLSYTVSEVLGPVVIEAPPSRSASIDLDDIPTLSAYLPGTLPAISFSLDNAMSPISTFSAASLSSGQMRAIATNNLGFDLNVVTVELYDVVIGATVGTPQSFSSGIADGETDTTIFNLAGSTISNTLEIRMSASTLGGTVLSASNKNIVTVMEFVGDLTVASATAEIPALSRTFSQQVELGESDALYHANISAGNLNLIVGNETGLTAVLDIEFPDIVNGSTPLHIQRTIPAHGSDAVAVDISGHELLPTDSTVPQNINVNVVASIPGTSPGVFAGIDQNDEFTVTATLTGLEFGSVSGVFSSVSSSIEPTREEIDVPDGFENMELSTAILTLEISNGVDLSGTLDITLEGSNGKTLNVTGNIDAGGAANPVVSFIIDTTVAEFLSPLPSWIDIAGNATFGDGVTEGTITANDFVYAQVNILAPMEMIIHESTIEGDIESENIDEDDIDIVTDHVEEARFVYNVISHLPLGARFEIYLGSDSTTLYTAPGLLIDDVSTVAAPLTAGIVNDTASTGYQTITLTNDDIQVLNTDTLFIGSLLVLEDSNGQPIRLTADDYVTIIGRIEVDYLFDGDF